MTTASVRTQVGPAGPDLARTRAGVAIGSHWLVDTMAFVIVALLPIFRTRLELDGFQTAAILATGSVCSGVVQPIAAWLSDRLDTRVLGTAGLLLGGLSVALFGYASSFWELWLLQALSQLGIGAYHPVAAAGVGRLSGRRRSLGLSIFFVAGMAGGVTGNTLSPVWVDAMSPRVGGVPDIGAGLRSLRWLVLPALVGFALLVWATHKVTHRAHDGQERHSTLTRAERRKRWQAVWILYAGNALRFTTNYALVQLIVLWAERRAETRVVEATAERLSVIASTINGPLQAAMQVGMGAAGLAAGVVLRAHHEKAALVAVPCLGAVSVACLPLASLFDPAGAIDPAVVAAFAMSVVAGMGFGGMIPVTLSLSQRLLPHRTSLASGLMLGGAWCMAATGPVIVSVVEPRVGLNGTFGVAAGMLLMSGVVSLLLPGGTLREVAE